MLRCSAIEIKNDLDKVYCTSYPTVLYKFHRFKSGWQATDEDPITIPPLSAFGEKDMDTMRELINVAQDDLYKVK